MLFEHRHDAVRDGIMDGPRPVILNSKGLKICVEQGLQFKANAHTAVTVSIVRPHENVGRFSGHGKHANLVHRGAVGGFNGTLSFALLYSRHPLLAFIL